jgi:hypothetical protein
MYVDKPSMQTLTRLIFNVTLHNDELLNSLDTSWTSQVAEPEIPAVRRKPETDVKTFSHARLTSFTSQCVSILFEKIDH